MKFLLVLFGSIAFLGTLEVLLMWLLNREFWRMRFGKVFTIGWPVATLAVVVARFVTLDETTPLWVVKLLMELAAFLFVGLVAVLMALVVLGIYKAGRRLTLRFTRRSKQTSISRRQFLRKSVRAIPALAVAGSGLGVVGSFSGIRTFDLPLRFKGLPQELDGFRILHLSDLHLGPFLGLDDLEELAERVSSGAPFDVVALIGDVADDLDLLAGALRIVKAIPSKYGHFATLGNHEYYRGIRRVHKIFGAGPIPLLVNEGLSLKGVDSAAPDVFLGGADDPVTLGWNADRDAFYRNAVFGSFEDASSDSFKLLLTHRPGAFDFASESGVDLSLAGHTHGGQLGLFGRSAFDILGEDNYLWGKYAKANSQLYTSSGVGHWFPFRLGCPAEAPTIILRS